MAEPEMVFFNGRDFRDGYTIIPERLRENPGGKAWVVVDVHGAGGLKGIRDHVWLTEYLAPVPIVILVPSFSDGYQSGDGKWAEQLLSQVAEIRKHVPVHRKLFLHGHSGGAQFVHRFAFHHPGVVAGVSAHSAGSWAGEPGFGTISEQAVSIPFLISCGDEDKAYSVPHAPFTRIEWFHRFAAELKRRGFVVYADTWPDTGHGVPHEQYATVFKECFALATRGEVPQSSGWQGDVEVVRRSRL
jgi:pimeloyl-ACP methyl ester carboxylesterase